MADEFDISDPKHDKTRRMLRDDLIAWFTTVSPDGVPHAVPVWFFWHDGRVIVFSKPGTVKEKHLRAGSPVLVHLQAGGDFGDDVVVLTGRADVSERDAASWLASFRDGYEQKYRAAIADFGIGTDDLIADYSVALVFTPERILAW